MSKISASGSSLKGGRCAVADGARISARRWREHGGETLRHGPGGCRACTGRLLSSAARFSFPTSRVAADSEDMVLSVSLLSLR